MGDTRVTVTICGPTGSGKTAVYMELYAALKAVGVTVEHDDPAEFQRLLNAGEADSSEGLELYKPTVTLKEVNDAR